MTDYEFCDVCEEMIERGGEECISPNCRKAICDKCAQTHQHCTGCQKRNAAMQKFGPMLELNDLAEAAEQASRVHVRLAMMAQRSLERARAQQKVVETALAAAQAKHAEVQILIARTEAA